MKGLDTTTLIVFEIIPLERLNGDETNKSVHSIISSLQQLGLELVSIAEINKIFCFTIKDVNRYQQLTNTITSLVPDNPPEEEDEHWILNDFFEYLVLYFTEYDVLFALASAKNLDERDLDSRFTKYMLYWKNLGGFSSQTSLARRLCAAALRQQGLVELGNSIDSRSLYPTETGLSGSISFQEFPLVFPDDVLAALNIRPWSLPSSKLLLSQEVLKVLRDETSIGEVELAKIVPLQLFVNKNMSLFNHFWIKARIGTQIETLQELATVSHHFNWQATEYYTKPLPKKQALTFGLAQLRRLKKIEKQEESLKQALALLQRRYPARIELFEFEINNLYSNVTRYSSAYLVWRTHLQALVQGDPSIDNQFTLLVRQVDWSSLEKLNIATSAEAEKIVGLLQIDPGMLLTKMRVLLEKSIAYLYERKYSHSTPISLHNMIQRLDRDHIFPPMISIYLVTLRTSGNVGAHTGASSKEDAEALLPLFVRVLEWFLDEGVSKI